MKKLELLDSSSSPSPHGSFSKDSMHTSSRQGQLGLG